MLFIGYSAALLKDTGEVSLLSPETDQGHSLVPGAMDTGIPQAGRVRDVCESNHAGVISVQGSRVCVYSKPRRCWLCMVPVPPVGGLCCAVSPGCATSPFTLTLGTIFFRGVDDIVL